MTHTLNDLLADIEAHCRQADDTPSALSRRVLGDSKAWARLKEGGDIYHRNYLKLRHYLDENQKVPAPRSVIDIVTARPKQRQRERHPENVNGNR